MDYLSSSVYSVLLWIFAISPACAHYCVWGLCESWEYCCDENVCCSYKDYNIWMIIVIIAAVVIGMILAGTCFYYNLNCLYFYLRQRYYGINSTSVPSEFETDGRLIKVSF
ncbi:uncharacterized protein LOC109853132 [Pseudomyrmex gracilis]|uniref:uncharacterized protein LOC109853132 n=1 Tax=Pseudomyrmex gracilis TaxID=219809 RepID=UPI0009957321|nr:uncharacterized protein LOC109853132 [Pseudomyrmex gracilis]